MNNKHLNVSKSTLSARESKDWYYSKKICTKCHTDEVYKNTKLCLTCLLDMRKDGKKYRKNQTQEQKDIKLKRDKRRMDLCIAFGICRYCQKRDVEKPYTYCAICLAKRRNKRTLKSESQGILLRHLRTEFGLCYNCGKNPIVKDKKVCSECLPIKQEAIRKCMKVTTEKGNENHIWRKLDTVMCNWK